MFAWLKKHFIPHEGNEHRPHLLRDYGVRNVLALVIFLEIFTFLLPVVSRLNISGGIAAVLPAVLSILTNEEREAENLPTLVINPILNQAAEMKAQDMASKGYFAHTSPEGKNPWYWLEQAGYEYQYAGENLAVNFNDSKDVTEAWMQSPTHRANIVKNKYTEVGTGVAAGVYEGRKAVFAVQLYANPLPKVFKTVNAQVLGAENVQHSVFNNPGLFRFPSFWQKLLSSPRNSTNMILYAFFAIVFIALLLYLFLRARYHHKDLVVNALFASAFLGIIFVANYYWSYAPMSVADDFHYSATEVQQLKEIML